MQSDTDRFVRNQFDLSEIFYENGLLNDAEEKLATGKNLMEKSELSESRKNILLRMYLWHSTRLAIKKGKIDQAKEYAEMYRKKAEKIESPFNKEINFSLSGLIAYAEGYFEKANVDVDRLIRMHEALDETQMVSDLQAYKKDLADYYEMVKKMARVYVKEGPVEGNKWMLKFDPFAAKGTARPQRERGNCRPS